jgi:hypothetical protein
MHTEFWWGNFLEGSNLENQEEVGLREVAQDHVEWRTVVSEVLRLRNLLPGRYLDNYNLLILE